MESRRQLDGPSETRALLLQLLEGACGSRDAAMSMLRIALVRSGLDGVPDTSEKALLFVRAHLLGRLSEEVGPRRAMALMDDLVERLEGPPASGVVLVPPPSSAHRIAALSVRAAPVPRGDLLLVDKDSLRRASTARTLVPSGWDVLPAQSHDELLDVAKKGERPAAVVVAAEHPSVEAIVRAAVDMWPGTAVVVHGELAQVSGDLLDFLLQLKQVRVCTRDESLLERLDSLLGGAHRVDGP